MASPTETPKSQNGNLDRNLFFNIEQEEETGSAAALLKGIEFPATYVVSETAGKFREIVLVISLKGIKVVESSHDKKRSRNFELEQILQYSYARLHSRFTFAYLEIDGVLTNYRFISKDFFEIHQTLGNAISLMVQQKGNMSPGSKQKKSSTKEKQSSRQLTGSNSSLPFDEVTKPGEKNFKQENKATEQKSQISSNPDLQKKLTGKENSFAKTEIVSNPDLLNSSSSKDKSMPKSEVSSNPDLLITSNSKTETCLSNPEIVKSPSGFQIHSGDDDSSSIHTVETIGNSDSKSQNENTKEKQRSSKSRQWSIFKGGSTLLRSAKISHDLISINENTDSRSHSHSKSEVLTMTGSISGIDKHRRKSLAEVFNQEPNSLQPNQGDKNLATLRRSSKSRLSLNPLGSSNNSQTITHEAMASPPAEPEVIKKYDEWGREILIKNHRNGKYEITAGTLQTLVESLAEEASPDTIYIEVFLLTFRHFMTPVQLLSLLQKRFRFQSETPNVASIIRVRVMSVLKKWVERHEYDFQTVEMQDLSKEFLLEASTTDVGKYALSIRNLIDSDANQRKYAELRTSDTPLSIRKVYDTIDFLTSWTPKKIAIELTLNDIKLFRQIKPDEFCIFLWGEKKDIRISNFNAYIDRFNRIGYWVGTVVCSEQDLRKRAEILEKFIMISKYLLKFNNYNTLMAIYSGLNTTAVTRLKKTWDIVNKNNKILSVYHEMETKLSYKGNFKAYREIEFLSKPPFIPFFGLYVKDLTFMNDGNQKHLAISSPKPNFSVSSNTSSAVTPSSVHQPTLTCTDMSSSVAPNRLLTSTTDSDNLSLAESAHLSPESYKPNTDLKEILNTAEPPAPEALVNFEKCRSITDKIHAIRVYQQSAYKFEEEKEETGGISNSIFSFQPVVSDQVHDTAMMAYLSSPYGPPAIMDEKRILALSKECEPSERKMESMPPHNYTTGTGGTSSIVVGAGDKTGLSSLSTAAKGSQTRASEVSLSNT